jgi:HAD superfamily hydrolase (TIGR01509 family)
LLGLRDDVAACVFDLEGVLIAGAVLHVAAWTRAFDDLTLGRTERTVGEFKPFDAHADYREYLEDRPRLDGVRSFLASRGISLPEGEPSDPPGAETVHGIANRKQEALLRLIDEQGVTAFAGSRHYLEFAREVGVRTAVVSASANTPAILRTAGLESLIDACIDGNAIAAGGMLVKPAPDTLLAACRALAAEPGVAVVFETSPVGVTAARAAGFAAVMAVDEGGNADALLGAGAGGVVQGLAELLERGLDR